MEAPLRARPNSKPAAGSRVRTRAARSLSRGCRRYQRLVAEAALHGNPQRHSCAVYRWRACGIGLWPGLCSLSLRPAPDTQRDCSKPHTGGAMWLAEQPQSMYCAACAPSAICLHFMKSMRKFHAPAPLVVPCGLSLSELPAFFFPPQICNTSTENLSQPKRNFPLAIKCWVLQPFLSILPRTQPVNKTGAKKLHNTTPPTAGMASLRVCTYNIRVDHDQDRGTIHDWPQRRRHAASAPLVRPCDAKGVLRALRCVPPRASTLRACWATLHRSLTPACPRGASGVRGAGARTGAGCALH